MTQRVFHAGLRHSVVDSRWNAFEEAFQNFDIQAAAHLGTAQIEAHLLDTRLIRDRTKLASIHTDNQLLHEDRRQRFAGGLYA